MKKANIQSQVIVSSCAMHLKGEADITVADIFDLFQFSLTFSSINLDRILTKLSSEVVCASLDFSLRKICL